MHTDIMSDKHQRTAFFLLHIFQHLNHTALHHHIKRRGRLIGKYQFGPQNCSASAMVTRCRMPPES